MPKYRVEYNDGDDIMDNWLMEDVEANNPDEAVLKVRYNTKDSAMEYVCTGQVQS
jgi:hypothetical protein